LEKIASTLKNALKVLLYLPHLRNEIQTSSRTLDEMRNSIRRPKLYWTWEKRTGIWK